MKRKVIGGILAFVAVNAIALTFSTSFRPVAPAPMQRLTAMDAAPQNKFGIREALVSDSSSPARARPEPPAAAAAEAAAAASEAASAAADASPQTMPTTAMVPGLPKVAYVYRYGYRIAGKDIADLQRAHADLCEKQGPRTCRILSLEQSGSAEDGYARGILELAVVAPRARSFGAELGRSVKAAGGSEVSTSIAGEDLSKSIVDTEARLRARTLLRDRLMEVLASRKGTVAELVEAERGVAQVNEEIDEARSWLTEMQGRVEFSRITITYDSASASFASDKQNGFLAPIQAVLGSLGAILGTIIALLIALAATLGPLGLAGWGFLRLWRRYRPAAPLVAEPAS